MTVRIIVATDLNGGIGHNGTLPWPKLVDDFKTFKQKTMNSVLVMGRHTYETLPDRLPGREIFVLSNQLDSNEVAVFNSMREAIDEAAIDKRDVWICGGERVYLEGLKYATEIHLTTVESVFPADVHFPKVDISHWRMQPDEMHHQTKEGLYYTISVYHRRFTR